LIAALAAAPCFASPEMVTLSTRSGVTQSFVILPIEGQPAAIALLYVGGGGRINLRKEGGEIKFGARNFLPRTANEWARNGVLPVVMDAPSDQQSELSDSYREGREQSVDARAVVEELRLRYGGRPVYIVGTSRGTISAAHIGRDLGADVAGVVLTSSLFGGTGRRQTQSLQGFDYGRIRAPLLFVHHRDDGCWATPYATAAQVGRRYELISVSGGKPPESGPCDPFAAHGYYGVEAGTVDAITAWMLKRPFPKEVK